MESFLQVQRHLIGTDAKQFKENPDRIGLLIQNLSSNTIYLMAKKQADNNQSIEIDGTPFDDDKKPTYAFSLAASGASSDVRVLETTCHE